MQEPSIFTNIGDRAYIDLNWYRINTVNGACDCQFLIYAMNRPIYIYIYIYIYMKIKREVLKYENDDSLR